jgi:plasmid stability protein
MLGFEKHHLKMHNESDMMQRWGMNAITVRNLPPGVAKAIRERARKEGVSLNRAVVKLLEEATGFTNTKPKKTVLHHDLDHLFGVWTKDEADEFDRFLKEHRSIVDPEMWK